MTAFQRLVCRVFHGRGEMAFAMPKPHPKGQQFAVRCRKCGNSYFVVTPGGWTSPWGAKADIKHTDYEDPVHQYQGQWYFWTVGKTSREGPYGLEREAREAHQRYYADLNEKLGKEPSPKPKRR